MPAGHAIARNAAMNPTLGGRSMGLSTRADAVAACYQRMQRLAGTGAAATAWDCRQMSDRTGQDRRAADRALARLGW